MNRVPQTYQNGVLVIVIDYSDLRRSANSWPMYSAQGRRCADRALPEPDPGKRGRAPRYRRSKCARTSTERTGWTWTLRTADPAAEVSRILGLGASLLTGRPVVEDG